MATLGATSSTTTFPAGGGSLTVQEVDGVPSVASVTTLKVPNGSLTDDGGGTVTFSPAGSGDVVGPGTATDEAIARFDTATGKLLQNSGITIADGASGSLAGTNSGDVTLAGTPDYITISGQTITRGSVDLAADITGDLPYANMVQASAASKLVGRGSAAGAGDLEEITLGASLSMSATTLSAATQTSALLDGSVHTDTVAQTVSRGSLIYGNSTPKWDELVIGSANRVLRSDGTDAAWSQVALATDVSGDLPFANMVQASAASKLVGRGSASGAGDFEEITLGSGLTMTATTLSASSSGGSGAWSLVSSVTASAQTHDFTGLSSYNEILIFCYAVTTSAAAVVAIFTSTNNGSTYMTTSGDYLSWSSSTWQGAADVSMSSSNFAAGATRYVVRQISLFNTTAPKFSWMPNSTAANTTYIIPTTTALNAVRVKCDTGGAGNFTGGTISVYGRS